MNEGFQYELWSDLMRVLGLYYGAASSPTQPAANRITRLLAPDGSVQLEYNSVGDVATHPGAVLEDVTILYGP
jgi:hypothetical protein